VCVLADQATNDKMHMDNNDSDDEYDDNNYNNKNKFLRT
jgi:hypothetical protein